MESKVFASLYCIQQIAKLSTKKQTLANFFTKCKPALHVALVNSWMFWMWLLALCKCISSCRSTFLCAQTYWLTTNILWIVACCFEVLSIIQYSHEHLLVILVCVCVCVFFSIQIATSLKTSVNYIIRIISWQSFWRCVNTIFSLNLHSQPMMNIFTC